MAKKKAGNAPEISEEIENNPEMAQEEIPAGTVKTQDAETLKTETDELKDKYLRLAAEYDNFRKRSQKEKEALYGSALADAAIRFLPVYDNLERALSMQTEDQAYYKGVSMIMSQLTDIFDKLGIKKLESAGEPFDPNFHNAVMETEDESLGENVVAEVFQQGFIMGDRVLRHATVKVANTK